MSILIEELKIRAHRLHQQLLKTDPDTLERVRKICLRKRWEMAPIWQHKHCLNLVSASCGFNDWSHARSILSGKAEHYDDMGDFWYGASATGFTNHWFVHYEEAKRYLISDAASYLIPFRKQFVVVTAAFIQALGLTEDAKVWASIDRDLCQAYGVSIWLALAQQRLLAWRFETA
ncbi:MAG: hypothetical protein K2P84_06665 [Undibacterium sp.]|nr:hypothetical protein [Undibacterium sp.]